MTTKSKKRRKRKARPVSVTGRKAFSIDEFCARHGISRPFYYKLRKQGKAPRVTKLGAQLRVITEEDETAWRQAMAAASERVCPVGNASHSESMESLNSA
jgi:predicted DNA-binding transcriptional regulator AlpA